MRNIARSKGGYNKICRVYGANYDVGDKLLKDAKLIDRFYAKEINRVENNTFNGNIKTVDLLVTLESPDFVLAKTDFFVEYDNNLYRIVDKTENIMVDKTENIMDHRGRILTTIVLRRRL